MEASIDRRAVGKTICARSIIADEALIVADADPDAGNKAIAELVVHSGADAEGREVEILAVVGEIGRAAIDRTRRPEGERAVRIGRAGSVNFGSTDFTDDSKNFDFTTFGISAGMDYKFSDRFVAGIG